MKKTHPLSLLRVTVLIIMLVGAIWSLSLTIQAGRGNDSLLLKILFGGWVLSPFVPLIVAYVHSGTWENSRKIILYGLMFFITLGSLVFYNGVLSVPHTRPAFIFMFIPFISWLIITIILIVSGILSRMLTRMRDSI